MKKIYPYNFPVYPEVWVVPWLSSRTVLHLPLDGTFGFNVSLHCIDEVTL